MELNWWKKQKIYKLFFRLKIEEKKKKRNNRNNEGKNGGN